MSDPLIARFADACGALGPLKLRVDLVGGGVLAEGSVAQPFTLVGRDDSCDVTLSDPDINPRHAWLQVLSGRVYVVDLGSRNGVAWAGGSRGSGWLDHGGAAKLGPFSVRLGAPVSTHPPALPPDYNPLAADPNARNRPHASLEFRNGKRARDRWGVNRLLTLVGRAPECKIHLTADDISLYHCGLVLTPHGLWVVDLSGRGVVVNGERMRVAPLPHGAELWVGRFLIGCQMQPPSGAGAGPTPNPGSPRPGTASADPGLENASSTSNGPRTPAPAGARAASEDEVELGAAPDSLPDLPASHIMADAFRSALSGPPSSPILVSTGSGPKPAAGSNGAVAGLLDSIGAEPTATAPLLRQMADLHDRAGREFSRWLALLPRLFAHVKREHLQVMLHELNRIESLSAEIAALQSEVSRRALEQAVTERAEASTDTDALPDAPAPLHAVDTATPLPPQSLARLTALQHQRAERWAAVIALFADA